VRSHILSTKYLNLFVMTPPILQTKRFVLKPYLTKDEDRYVEMALDEVSIAFMGGDRDKEEEERALFKKIFGIYQAEGPRVFWIWGIYENEVLFGHLELKETEHTNEDELEMVYMVHPNCSRIGVMTEVLGKIKDEQENWNRRIIATVRPNNLASLKLLKRWGVEQTEVLMNKDTNEQYLKLLLTST